MTGSAATPVRDVEGCHAPRPTRRQSSPGYVFICVAISQRRAHDPKRCHIRFRRCPSLQLVYRQGHMFAEGYAASWQQERVVMIVNGRAYRKRAPVCNMEGHARAAKKHMSKAKHRSKMASRDRRRSSPTPALDRHTSRIKELERYGCTMSCERGVVQLEIKSRRNGMPVTSLRRGRRRIGTCRLRTPVVYTYGRRLYA